jgi:hypothetical protein
MKLLCTYLLCLFSFTLLGQFAHKPHAHFLHSNNRSKLFLKFNKGYYLYIHSSGRQKLEDTSQHIQYLHLINQIKDTLIFKEGKLLATDIEALYYLEPWRRYTLVAAATFYTPFALVYLLNNAKVRTDLVPLVPVTFLLAGVSLRLYEPKFVPLDQYQLQWQNIQGKEPKKKNYFKD